MLNQKLPISTISGLALDQNKELPDLVGLVTILQIGMVSVSL